MSQYQGAPVAAPEHAAPPSATGAHQAAFPRVNLIPPAIAEEARVRRAKLVLLGAGAISVALIGGLYVLAQGEVAAAQDGLDTATAQSAQLATQVAQYSDVPKVAAELSAAQAQLTTAMGDEVRWSYLLNDLALTIPSNVALTSYVGQLSPSTSTGATAATDPAATTEGTTAAGPIGAIQFEGEATGYKAIASWLNSQDKQKTYTDMTLTAAQRQEGEAGAHTVITWSSNTELTDKALSHRYDGTK